MIALFGIAWMPDTFQLPRQIAWITTPLAGIVIVYFFFGDLNPRTIRAHDRMPPHATKRQTRHLTRSIRVQTRRVVRRSSAQPCLYVIGSANTASAHRDS